MKIDIVANSSDKLPIRVKPKEGWTVSQIGGAGDYTDVECVLFKFATHEVDEDGHDYIIMKVSFEHANNGELLEAYTHFQHNVPSGDHHESISFTLPIEIAVDLCFERL